MEGISLHKYIGALDLYKYPTLVVSDSTYDHYYHRSKREDIDTFIGLQFDDNMASGKTVQAIDAILPARFHIGGLPGNISYIGVYQANFELFGSYVFIGFFLGVLFLLASGSIMYYKLIMEAGEEKSRYRILKKMGMKKKEIQKSIAKQLGIVFGVPFLTGLLRAVFGLLFYNRTLGTVGEQTSTFQNAMTAVVIFSLVYGAFYLLSAKCYYHIVWKKMAE